ncbi:MAG: hypothetical protein JWQ96_1999 [Segetibacter sp.]|nr:hypothetical protein [Segetibacter sp.]
MEIKLSQRELELVINEEWLITKSRIIKKVIALLANTSHSYTQIGASLPTEFVRVPPKISRGENYKGLPYVMLDYPRNFTKDNFFAIRCFFWWGNFFSITLHLSGNMQHRYADKIANELVALNKEGWHFQEGIDEWDHTFENNNFVVIDPSKNYKCQSRRFVKLAKKIPLQEWDDVPLFFEKNFSFLVKLFR